jgi:hypothetical protein
MADHQYSFAGKSAAREAMARLQNLVFQMKYSPYQGDRYQDYRRQIGEMLGGEDKP